jgi:hypothetical protein
MNYQEITFLRCRRLGFFIVFLVWAGLSLADNEVEKDTSPIEISAKVDKSPVTIGDKIMYTIVVKAKRNIEVRFPQLSTDELGGLAIRDFGSTEKKWWNRKTYKHWYELDTYTSGQYTIPEMTVKYRRKGDKEWQEVKVNEVSVEVKSILKTAEDSSDIRDIAPPVSFPHRIWPFIFWGAGILLVIGSVAFIYFVRKKKEQNALLPPSAHKIAYEALEALKRKEYIRYGKVKEYYSELSDIVRRYLENRFSLRAPEMTTEEFLKAVKDNKLLSSEHKSLLRDFLSHCDMVKFAKYLPVEEEANLSFMSAKKLINQTKEKEEVDRIQEIK